MNRIAKIFHIGTVVFSIIIANNSVFAQDDLRVWREFVDTLMSGKMTTAKIHPHREFDESFKSTLLGFLEIARKEAQPRDWDAIPEIIRRDSIYHYIISLTTKEEKVPYCFTFVEEGTSWYFRHLEAIFIRLDTLSTFPTTVFPDISDRQKAWAREEIYWSFIILNVYLPTVRDKGKEAALNQLKDGGGYFVGAKTWVPFSPPHKAFIQYLCWEQAHLRENPVELKKLNDNEAVVRLYQKTITDKSSKRSGRTVLHTPAGNWILSI